MIAGIVVGSIIGAFFLVLCIPFYSSVELRIEKVYEFRLRLRWLFGAFKKEFPNPKKRASEARVGAKRDDGGKKDSDGRWGKLLGRMITEDESRERAGRLVRAVIRSARKERLEADFRLGLPDPADTAIILGPVGAASVLSNLYSDYGIWLLPDLQGEKIEGYLHARVCWLPIRLFRPVLSFIASRVGRGIVKRVLSRR